ncbi:unnamed protein product [Effrenium voratum]|uniref:Peptidase A1 domain-containing protein n=1 Tax=Effrenium voratum TaxID=2562239 RepID=A0AA36JCY9_9DINO|nr:unnamed protein product [Effrenium voratum]
MEGAVRQFSRDCSGHAMLALEPPSHTRSAYWRPYAGERCTTRWSHDGHDHTARSVTCAACAAFARQCARNPRHEGKVRVEAKGASDLRQGFKVNTKYRGAASYGTISQEEMEEAERIRNQYTTDLSSIKKADVQPARKRLLLKRLKPGFAAGSRTKRLVQVVQHRQESEAEVEAEEEAEAEEPNVAETGSERSSEPGSREAGVQGPEMCGTLRFPLSVSNVALHLAASFAMPSLVAIVFGVFTDPGAEPLVVRLQRVATESSDASKSVHFYVGRLEVGKPAQSFQVLFDTASGHVLLPHSSCGTNACHQHKQFSPSHSETAVDVNTDGLPVQKGHKLVLGRVQRDAVSLEFTQADLGVGVAKAVLVQDKVCLGTEFGGQICTNLDVMAAVEMQQPLFEQMPYDGIVGLGLPGLTTETGCDFFARLTEARPGLVPQLGLAFGAQSGELFLGGHEPKRMKSPLQWFPVLHPQDGFWEVAIQSVRLGNLTVHACAAPHGCRGIIDTGASRLGVQRENFAALHAAMSEKTSPLVGVAAARRKGRRASAGRGADLEFDLGPMSLKLRVEDYAGQNCEVQLGPLDLDGEFQNVYAPRRQIPNPFGPFATILFASRGDCGASGSVQAFGENLLRQYYTALDWRQRRIGFAPAAPRRVRLGSGSGGSGSGDADARIFAFLPGLADTANLTSSLQSWEGWAPAMDLAGARRVAAAPRSAAASALKAAARALSAADEHELCAQVLLELRDFGVDREVLERRLSPAAANALFEETALRLGLALRDAGQRQDAWEALMAVCAQPALGQHLRKPSLQALAEVSERLANATSDPYLQVQYLQGVLDAEVVLQALPRDRREGLELYLALSMEKTGQEQESRQILTRLARKGTSRRRKQAEWAILVQDAEVEDDGAQSAEMKGIWNEVQLPSSSRLGGAGAAARRQASGASSFGLPGGGAAVLAVALLALPLALPLLLLGPK